MNTRLRDSSVLIGLVLFTTFVVSGAEHSFPEAFQRIMRWQVNLIENPTPHPAVTLIKVKPQKGITCGNGNWNRTFIAQTITALSQAEARIIAPMFSLEGPSSSACGGAVSDANLIEATAQSGKLVYLDSAFEPIKTHALAVGSLGSPPFFGLEVQPLGVSMAQGYGMALTADHRHPPVVPSLENVSLPTYSFNAMWNLIQTQQWNELKNLADGNIIILTPEINETVLAQISMLNAILTDSWHQPLGLKWQPLLLFVFSLSTAWVVFYLPNVKGAMTALVLLFVIVTMSTYLQTQWRWILPLMPMLLAMTCTTVSVGFFLTTRGKRLTSIRIRSLEGNLSQLREELTVREKTALALEHSLQEAQLAAQDFADRSEQLELAQAEIQTTRKQLQEVEAELQALREPMTESRKEPPAALPNLEPLSLECETFGILTKDPGLLKVFSDLKKAARSCNPILFLGETGTGKEVFAQAAHRLSGREKQPFIPVNMAAIRPELFESELFGHVKGAFTSALGGKGYVEEAEGGTLFLDEIGELSPDLQTKLLRLLENKTYHRVGEAHPHQANVRILAATNRDLKLEVQEGRFREDLYYRLRSIVLYLPPLRERVSEDRSLLADHLLQEFAHQDNRDVPQLTRAALHTIVSYPWPGNIRELKQTLAQAVSLADTNLLRIEDLRLGDDLGVPKRQVRQVPSKAKSGQANKPPLRDDNTILTALRQHGFDMQATAFALQCDRSTITQRLKGLGYQALVKNHGDFSLAAKDLAKNESLEELVEHKLREYEANLLPVRKGYTSVEDAIVDCRRRFKNLPDRYFPAVEMLIRHRFPSS